MNRRSMLGTLVAVLAVPFAGLAKASAKEQLHVEVVHTANGYSRVTGSVQSIERFHDAWQTSLWPDWKTNASGGARREWKKVRKFCPVNRAGLQRVLFDTKSAINRKALKTACHCGMSVTQSCEPGGQFPYA